MIALLIHKFGAENVETEIPITETEIDVKVYGHPISIKTITGRSLSGVKLIWTVDPSKVIQSIELHEPAETGYKPSRYKFISRGASFHDETPSNVTHTS